MKIFLNRFKEWVYIWFWLVFTISISLFAYSAYTSISPVNPWDTLSSETFNQIIADLEDVNSRLSYEVKNVKQVNWKIAPINLINWVWMDVDLDSNTINWDLGLIDWNKLIAPVDWIYYASLSKAMIQKTQFIYSWIFLNDSIYIWYSWRETNNFHSFSTSTTVYMKKWDFITFRLNTYGSNSWLTELPTFHFGLIKEDK